MLLSEIITKLQEVHQEHGDMRFTCTVLDTYPQEESYWGENFVGVEVDGFDDGLPYCDIIMGTKFDTTSRSAEKNEEA